MNPNHGGLQVSLRNQQEAMLTNYVGTIIGTHEIDVVMIDHSTMEHGLRVHYLLDGEECVWEYPGSLPDFVYEQTMRLITAEYMPGQ